MDISRIRWLASAPGLERMDALFKGFAFSPHRHDTYAVGMTLAGVQSFTYRGSLRHSLAGDAFVLHPDERHDGRAGDARGFGYRIAYIEPSLIRDAAGTGSLPFLNAPVTRDSRLRRAVRNLLSDPADAVDELAAVSHLSGLAQALSRLAGCAGQPRGPHDVKAAERVREFILTAPDRRIAIAELERVSGLSRWELARQFRKAFGVSPYRFHLLRRLAHARELLGRGLPLADVALASGFADQAHFSRHFRNAYGTTPGRWQSLVAADGGGEHLWPAASRVSLS
jgi:AraC-like DNA-binding protein